MAIVRKQNPIQARLVEIGRCYKGGASGTSKKSSLYKGGDDFASSYIRFEPADRFKLSPASSDKFHNLFEELKAAWEDMISQGSISIRFPSPTIEENFTYSNKVTKGIGNTTKTFRECDGETCTKWVESAPHPVKSGQTIPVFKRGAKPCSAIEGKDCPEGCKAKGMLKFMIPDLYPGGIIVFPLNSPVDVGAIAAYLEPFRSLDLSAVPFNLFRMKQDVSWEEKGETKSKANWGIHLAIDPTFSRLMLQGSERRYRAQMEIGDFTPVRSLRSNSAIASLPPATETLPSLRRTDDGMAFQQDVQRSIRETDIALLREVVEDAKELVWSGIYSKESMGWIESEERRAMEAIARVPTARVELAPQRAAQPKRSQATSSTSEATIEAPATVVSDGDELISKSDRAHLWKTAQSTGYSEDGFRGLVEMFGFSGSEKITAIAYEGILEAAADRDLAIEMNAGGAIVTEEN